MADELRRPNKYMKKAILAGAWIVGAWAPVQTAYEYLSKEAAFFGVNGSALPRALAYTCYITGALLFLWGVVTIVISLLLWWSTGAFKNDDKSNLKMLLEFIGAGSLSAIFLVYELALDHSFKIPRFAEVEWGRPGVILSTVLGGVMLWYAYLMVYRSATATIKEMKADGELGT